MLIFFTQYYYDITNWKRGCQDVSALMKMCNISTLMLLDITDPFGPPKLRGC